jgi:hypothetical protein
MELNHKRIYEIRDKLGPLLNKYGNFEVKILSSYTDVLGLFIPWDRYQRDGFVITAPIDFLRRRSDLDNNLDNDNLDNEDTNDNTLAEYCLRNNEYALYSTPYNSTNERVKTLEDLCRLFYKHYLVKYCLRNILSKVMAFHLRNIGNRKNKQRSLLETCRLQLSTRDLSISREYVLSF